MGKSFIRRHAAGNAALILCIVSIFRAGAASAQTQIRGRAMVLVDTSGSMVWHFGDCAPSGGDGGAAALFCDNGIGTSFTCAQNLACTAANGALARFSTTPANPSRLYAAKAALNDVINSASGSIDFGLERYTLGSAADYGVAVCSDPLSCCTTQVDASTRGRCVPQAMSDYPGVAGSVSCVGGLSSPCNLTYVAGCGTSAGCQSDCASKQGGQILVNPGPQSSTSVLPWVDSVEDFCSSTPTPGGAPRNPELRAAGGTPLAGAVRSALKQWYKPVYEVSKKTLPTYDPTSPLFDAKLDCRSYVNVVMTDGGESCEAPAVWFSDPQAAVSELSALNSTNPVKTYVIAVSFARNESCNGTAADGTVCPKTGPGNGCKLDGSALVCACASDADCGVTCDGVHYVCGTDGICHHPALASLNAMAASGGTGQARFVNNQLEIETAFADIVESTMKIERCNGLDDDCDDVCDNPFPDVAISNPACANYPRAARSCDNGTLDGSHCHAEGVYVCSADGLGVTCNAPRCDSAHPELCPVAETCDGVDEDCNGIIDDCAPFVPRSCCQAACPACNPTGEPMPELCNGCDDDCDGIIDDHLEDPRIGVIGGVPCVPLPAAQTQPPCDPGVTVCRNGQIQCDGEVLPRVNQCDGISVDCTGQPNVNGNCGSGYQCNQGQCSPPCGAGEFPCAGGFVCDRRTNLCIPNACAKLSCDQGKLCELDDNDVSRATCVDPCTRVTCPIGHACVSGACVDQTCRVTGCPAGQLCLGTPPACKVDPCAGVSCGDGRYCTADGSCASVCASCSLSMLCQDGACVEGPCTKMTCPEGKRCAVSGSVGMCVENRCSASCGAGQRCCGGSCRADLCLATRCPDGHHCDFDSSCNPSCQPDPLDNQVSVAAGGAGGDGGCSTGGGSTPAGLATLLVALLLARRRRASSWLVVVAALAVGSAGCRERRVYLWVDDAGAAIGVVTKDAGADAPSNRQDGRADLLFDRMTDVDPDGATCVPSNGGVEICDHLDNDCNGTTDDVAAARLTEDPNNCGACFNVCEFASLHQYGACAGGEGGVPHCAATGCQPGWWDIDGDQDDGCEYQCEQTAGGVEVCDGADNDCDGDTDEELVPVSVPCASQGVCAGNTIPVVCRGASGWKCDYSGVAKVALDDAGNLALIESDCDGLDNNCNGVTDRDGFPKLGTACAAGAGVCQNSGVIQCKPDGTAACSVTESLERATDESCNGLDDNCNGLTDEATDWTNPVSGKTTKGWHDEVIPVALSGGGTVYIYRYEASRTDATPGWQGAAAGRACSKPGVVPWSSVTRAQAQAACSAVKDAAGAPLRLCTAGEWQQACEGPGGAAVQKFSLSKNPATYVAGICNDINQSTNPAVWPTGSAGAQSVALGESCYTDWAGAGALHDMSGNLAEWTGTSMFVGGNTYYEIRGGAFSSPPGGTACEFDFNVAQSSFAGLDVGFRCCSDHPICGDTLSDPANCGACGVVCPAPQVCSQGTCQAACAAGLTGCGRACVDTSGDVAHCGTCGHACAAGQLCLAGQCACPGGKTSCGAACADLQSDVNNCGTCGHTCASGEVCSAGSCSAGCGSGLAACQGGCKNLMNDAQNCGGCGVACTAGQVCSSGACCAAGSVCGNLCVDLQTDSNHCGTCDVACGAGQSCQAGVCCATGNTVCGSSCVNLQTDSSHCGTCDVVCGAGQSCQGGVCCAAGSTACSQMCVDVKTDSQNCGGCGQVCPPSTSCTDGACCPTGFAGCGASCVDLKNDPQNCGSCGAKCGSSGTCKNGSCTCAPYHSLCNGSCIPTAADPNNCGGCGVVCGSGQVCLSSACTGGCQGLTACSGACVETQSDNKNCGACGRVCAAGTGCVGGTCVAAVPVSGAPARCVGAGPAIILDDGTTKTCSGNTAATSFAWALCTCGNIGVPQLGGSQNFDAYDSTQGPYVAGGKGGGVGLNGSYSSQGAASISGDFWASSPSGLSGNTSVDWQLHVGGALSGGTTVGGDAFVIGPYTSVSGNVGGTLHTPVCSAAPASWAPRCVSEPVSVPPPCQRCAPADQVPVAGYVGYYADPSHNDNAAIGLQAGTYNGTNPNPPTRLDLPCGFYYLDRVSIGSSVTIAAHGNTALFIGGSLDVRGTLTLAVDPDARFDVFIGGVLYANGPLTVGSAAYPALTSVYVGGVCKAGGASCLQNGECCSASCTAGSCAAGTILPAGSNPWATYIKSAGAVAGDLYAPNGEVYASASFTMYGSIFAGSYQGKASTTIHYDRAAVGLAASCPTTPGAPTGCNSCLDCGNQACVSGKCGACTTDSQCCAPLRCLSGTCKFAALF